MIEEVEDRAFGGVLVDARGRVCLVRPTGRGLWALPKGHGEPGEDPAAAALREVYEETGCEARLGPYLGSIRYTYPGVHAGRPVSVLKTVRFWRMSPAGESGAGNGDGEIEAVAWMSLPDALAALGYPTERALIQACRDWILVPAREPGSGPGQTQAPVP